MIKNSIYKEHTCSFSVLRAFPGCHHYLVHQQILRPQNPMIRDHELLIYTVFSGWNVAKDNSWSLELQVIFKHIFSYIVYIFKNFYFYTRTKEVSVFKKRGQLKTLKTKSFLGIAEVFMSCFKKNLLQCSF